MLGDGIHVTYYPKPGARVAPGGAPLLVDAAHPAPTAPRAKRPPTCAELATDYAVWGVRTFVAHDVTDPLRWFTVKIQDQLAAEHAAACVRLGLVRAPLEFAAGCGSRGPSRWQQLAASIEACVHRGLSVYADWEGSWDHGAKPAAQAAVAYLVDKLGADVVRAHLTDVPWWAPLYIINSKGQKIGTHPDAPTAEWGAGMAEGGERWPQVYGAGSGEDASARMLAWARHPSQYAAIAKTAGRRDPWTIRPCVQAYTRSLDDHVRMFLSESGVLVWQYTELDAACELALRVVAALRDRGFAGATAVRDFQAKQGLTIDGIVGPQTLRALGLAA